jgi:hypothetical protein
MEQYAPVMEVLSNCKSVTVRQATDNERLAKGSTLILGKQRGFQQSLCDIIHSADFWYGIQCQDLAWRLPGRERVAGFWRSLPRRTQRCAPLFRQRPPAKLSGVQLETSISTSKVLFVCPSRRRTPLPRPSLPESATRHERVYAIASDPRRRSTSAIPFFVPFEYKPFVTRFETAWLGADTHLVTQWTSRTACTLLSLSNPRQWDLLPGCLFLAARRCR